MNNFRENKTIKSFVGHLLGLFFITCVVIAAAIILFNNSLGWFASNKDVNGTGMQISVNASDYEIIMLDGGNDGLYYTNYHSLVKDSSALVWQMTSDYNIYNYDSNSEDVEIYPGTHGVISFYVKPKIDSINLNFSFEILGYTAEENEETHEITMTQLTQSDEPARYLNGHILLFRGRTGTEGSYIYSDPILTNADFEKIFTDTYNSTTENDGKIRVDIYWVWPHTLSDLIDARECTKITVTKEPFVESGEDYNAVVDNIRTYTDYYCKGVTRPADEASRPTEAQIATDYDIYGDYYDLADNDIGMEVDFILIKMTVSKSGT